MKVIYYLILLVSVSCSSKLKMNEIEFTDNEGVPCSWNTSKTYALCTSEVSNKQSMISELKYYILNVDQTKIVEGMVEGGISWLDDQSIVISQVPGTMRVGDTRDDYKKVYIIPSSKFVPYKEYTISASQ